MLKRCLSKCLVAVTAITAMAPAFAVAPHASAADPGGNAYFDAVFYWDGNAYTDFTAAAKNATASDTQLGSAGSANGIIYFGMQSPVDKLYFEFGQWGGSNGSLVWEFSRSSCFPPYTSCWISPTSETNPSADFKFASGDGLTYVELAPPTAFEKRTVNGVDAYWIRARTTSDYGFTAPKATQVKARAYNVKATIQKEGGIAITNSMPAWLADAGCTVNDGEWNVGDGTHYYALRTDGGSCSIKFLLDGYIDYSVFSTTNMSTILKDLGTYVLKPRIKVTLKDEVGNELADPTIWYDGTYGIEYTVGNDHYIPAPVSASKELSVTYNGYVSENGAGGGTNAGFGDVSTSQSMQTIIDMTGPTPCNGPIGGGITSCRTMKRDGLVSVLGPGNTPITGASVKVYTDAGYTTLANDLAYSGMNDAQRTSDADGDAMFALDTGTYYVKVTASGYNDATGPWAVTSGVLNQKTMTVSVPSQEPPQDTTVSASVSTIGVSPSSIIADGVKTATLTVVAKNASGAALSGKTVTANSSLSGVTITPTSATTNASGIATFTVKSSVQGSATLTAVAGGVSLSGQATLALTPPPQSECQSPIVAIGSLVKLPDDGDPNTQADSAVYYYGKDCKRHAFPNEKVYFSWYADFSNVTTVQAGTLASMMLGSNVTYRPGVKMVKFTTDNNVYAVSKGGVLRWVTSEGIATSLYGSDWNKKIDDINDAFYVNYTFGSAINSASDYNVQAEKDNAMTIDDSL